MKLPDVAKETHLHFTPLNWVGMEKIMIPLHFPLSPVALMAEVAVFVSLDRTEARGIHMSRLYLAVQSLAEKKSLNFSDLFLTLEKILESHRDLSRNAKMNLKLQLPLLRSSLKSELKSWKSYPIDCELRQLDQVQELEISFQVEYSSTCPASTALAREANREKFLEVFEKTETLTKSQVAEFLSTPDGLSATPHAQRSLATLKLRLGPELDWNEIVSWIDAVESVLKTPVQGAVKRADEQEFARLNGQNPLFCEDSARRIHQFLDEQLKVKAYRLKVEHFESLHAHNAVAEKFKNWNS